MGLIAMSERDLQRIEVLSKVTAGRITVVSAAHVLDLSERQVRRLLQRMRTGGAASIRHKAIGRPSNNRINDGVRDYAMTLVRERYADFGPTLATEKLAELDGLRVSRETVRGWMSEAGLWLSRKQRRTFHQPRLRREAYGELVQIDGSDHRWFEDRGPPCSLLVFVDDATGRLMQLRFVRSESAFTYFEALVSVIDPDPAYEPLGALISGAVNMAVIEQHWDEVLRLKASIGAGLVPPSVILKKLAASPRQNRLNQALREMGRIERSIFICDWLLDTKLRRRSHAILNKGESRHALARAVFLHQLGELRNRVAETMAYRASGLNLVVNAIILWNTVYLSRAVDYVRTQGIDIPAELLSQVAPLPWAHIALTGDYLWNEIDRPLERFRPIRANRFNPNNFAFP